MFKELQVEEALLALGLLAAPLVFKVILASKATSPGPKRFAKAFASSGMAKEHHEVVVIAVQGVRELRRR